MGRNPDNPPSRYRNIERLAASVQTWGLIQPIAVVPIEAWQSSDEGHVHHHRHYGLGLNLSLVLDLQITGHGHGDHDGDCDGGLLGDGLVLGD